MAARRSAARLRGGGSSSWRGAIWPTARALCALLSALLSRGGRRRAAFTAPLPTVPRSRSSRRRRHAAALTAHSRSAAAVPRRRLFPWRDASLPAACALCTCRRRCRVLSRQAACERLSRHCAATCGAALAALAPASWCRRTRGGMALGHRSSAAASLAIGVMQRGRRRVHSARAIGAVRSSLGRSLSRGSHSAAACGAAPAVLAPAPSCRRTRGDVAHGRRCSAVAALLLGAVRRSRRRALSARCCRRSSLGSVVVARLSGAASCGAALRVIRDSPSNAVACQRLVRRRTRSPVA